MCKLKHQGGNHLITLVLCMCTANTPSIMKLINHIVKVWYGYLKIEVGSDYIETRDKIMMALLVIAELM